MPQLEANRTAMNALTIADLLTAGTERLSDLSTSARLDTEILLGLALRKPREFLYAWPEEFVSDEQQVTFDALLQRRALGEPIAYITGWREFWSLNLQVTPATLIPRPETERLVELALQCTPQDAPWRIADIGTGSGAIGVAIACERPRARVTAVDLSEACVEVARANGARLDLANLVVRHGDLFDALDDAPHQLIVSNPPYIADGDPHLYLGDVRSEPLSALVAGDDGLDVLRELIGQAPQHLDRSGVLAVEHGFDQGAAVRALMRTAGLGTVETFRDYGGRERVTRATHEAP